MYVCVCVQSLSRVYLSGAPWTVTCQDPSSWNFPGKNTGAGCYFLPQGIFQSKGLNLSLRIGRWVLYHWITREAQSNEDKYLIWPSKSTLGSFPKRNENMLTQWAALKYSTRVFLIAKLRNNPVIQQLVYRWKKNKRVYLYKGILHDSKKKK